MNRIVTLLTFSLAVLVAAGAFAAPVNFLYSQTATNTGFGNIDPFVFNDGGGNITFGPTAMPAAVVFNPNPSLTPAGFVGAENAMASDANEANVVVGLTWSGSVTATGTRGAQTFKMDIPLRFVPKVTQSPTDLNDYQWIVTYGDSVANGVDTTSTNAGPRFAMWYSRDDVADGNIATANTFQRYTQVNNAFTAGPNIFTNTDTTTAPIKDATDSGDPQGTDAAGRNLAFYFGWRDQNGISGGPILIDDFTVGGLLNTNEASLRLVPEPSSFVLAGMAMVAGVYWRKRQRS